MALMPFANEYAQVYTHAIKPACIQHNIEPFRVDEDPGRPGVISADLIEDIRKADFLVADLSKANPNVFYELGYAHAFGKRVILAADSVCRNEVPFDVRIYRIIYYDRSKPGLDALQYTLQSSIAGVIAEITQRDALGTVNAFYQAVSERRYADAWPLLGSSLQDRLGPMSRFAKGYDSTLRLRNLSVSSMSRISDSSEEIMVFFASDSNAPVIDELRGISKMKIGSLPDLQGRLAALSSTIASEGYNIDAFNNLTLQQLLAPNRGEILAWLLQQESESNVPTILQNTNQITTVFSLRVNVDKLDGMWRITKIRPLDIE